MSHSGWRRLRVLDHHDVDLLRYRTLAQVETLERLVEGDDSERWDHGVCASRRRAKIILLLVISYEREVPDKLVIVRETITRAPGHQSGIACPRGRRRAREAARVPGRRDDRRRGPERGRMRLFVFRCPGPSPVVTERSGESRAQAGALVVIHPKSEQWGSPR
jgi:hypothetical protein